MDMLIGLVMNISHCICISGNWVVHFKNVQFCIVNPTSIKLGDKRNIETLFIVARGSVQKKA